MLGLGQKNTPSFSPSLVTSLLASLSLSLALERPLPPPPRVRATTVLPTPMSNKSSLPSVPRSTWISTLNSGLASGWIASSVGRSRYDVSNMNASPLSNFVGSSAASLAFSKVAASGPCGVQQECSEQPPGKKPEPCFVLPCLAS